MRLIDPMELKQSLAISSILAEGKTLEQIIDEQPTIEERKTGRWIDITKTGGDFIWKCSECGELNLEDTYFCPNCGARMMEVEHD